eukprot:TRINITY_DN6299_c0_g2_i1.p1 TRINITY_DN6299_c0_g2~~TRINITY_DN6299_c0_g2_i1.p1  ORF type:complete len:218 (+),score=50.09 TRINITY_DN6299_c0_g2_i1:49-654(+)
MCIRDRYMGNITNSGFINRKKVNKENFRKIELFSMKTIIIFSCILVLAFGAVDFNFKNCNPNPSVYNVNRVTIDTLPVVRGKPDYITLVSSCTHLNQANDCSFLLSFQYGTVNSDQQIKSLQFRVKIGAVQVYQEDVPQSATLKAGDAYSVQYGLPIPSYVPRVSDLLSLNCLSNKHFLTLGELHRRFLAQKRQRRLPFMQ